MFFSSILCSFCLFFFYLISLRLSFFFFFFFNDPAPPEFSPLPLHDPLPIPGSRGGRPPSSTVVSCSPAITCAFVTTTPASATQPEPSMASPQAVPMTRTTPREAALIEIGRAHV